MELYNKNLLSELLKVGEKYTSNLDSKKDVFLKSLVFNKIDFSKKEGGELEGYIIVFKERNSFDNIYYSWEQNHRIVLKLLSFIDDDTKKIISNEYKNIEDVDEALLKLKDLGFVINL